MSLAMARAALEEAKRLQALAEKHTAEARTYLTELEGLPWYRPFKYMKVRGQINECLDKANTLGAQVRHQLAIERFYRSLDERAP